MDCDATLVGDVGESLAGFRVLAGSSGTGPGGAGSDDGVLLIGAYIIY